MNRKLLLIAGFVLAHAYATVAVAQPQESRPAPGQAQAPASAEATALASAKAESQAADDLNKIVCKYMPLTGSRMGRKVCHTQAEWTAMEGGADTFMRDMQARGGMNPLDSNGAAGGGQQSSSVFDPPGG